MDDQIFEVKVSYVFRLLFLFVIIFIYILYICVYMCVWVYVYLWYTRIGRMCSFYHHLIFLLSPAITYCNFFFFYCEYLVFLLLGKFVISFIIVYYLYHSLIFQNNQKSTLSISIFLHLLPC